MLLTEEQDDTIQNALLVGMALDDAYVMAGLDPDQIASVADSEPHQRKYAQVIKQHEFSLLTKLDGVVEKQARAGREQALTWKLEHMFPRYTNKQIVEGQPITINFEHKAADADVEYDV